MNQTQELKKLINSIPHKDRYFMRKLFIQDLDAMKVAITFKRKSNKYNRIIEILENNFIPYEEWDNIGCDENSNYTWTYYNIKISDPTIINQLNITPEEIHHL